MNKLRDYIKLVCFSFAALLIFAALVFLVFWIMINKLNPPFSATLPSAVTPSLGPYSGGLTSTLTKLPITPSLSVPSQTSPVATSQTSPAVTPSLGPYSGGLTSTLTNPQITPSLSVPSQTSPVATSQISPAGTSQKQSWKQGMMVYLARLPSGFNAMYMLNLETGTPPRLLLQPTTNQHYYGPWLSPDSSSVVFYDINGSDGIMDLQDLSVKLFKACNSPTYSPDGNQIICGEGGHFRILDAATGASSEPWRPVSMAGCRFFRRMGRRSLLRFSEAEIRPASGGSTPQVGHLYPWHPKPSKTIAQHGHRMEIGLLINPVPLMVARKSG